MKPGLKVWPILFTRELQSQSYLRLLSIGSVIQTEVCC